MGLSQRGDGEGAMTSFVFYDTETTGTDTVFDQILQFAAILTDDNMRELDNSNSLSNCWHVAYQPQAHWS